VQKRHGYQAGMQACAHEKDTGIMINLVLRCEEMRQNTKTKKQSKTKSKQNMEKGDD